MGRILASQGGNYAPVVETRRYEVIGISFQCGPGTGRDTWAPP